MPRDDDAKHISIHPETHAIPFAQFQANGWSLEVECVRCKRVRSFGPDELVERFGPDGTTGRLFKRLKCECGVGLPAMTAVKRP